MGLINDGKALTWEESLKFLRHVKDHGIQQFIRLYLTYKNASNSQFLWGDETEYLVLKRTNEGVKVSNSGCKAITLFNTQFSDQTVCKLLPEYGSFMIESTPAVPYQGDLCGLLQVEHNMRQRRSIIASLLEADEFLITMSNFPRLGTEGYCFPPHYGLSDNAFSKSIYFSDHSINPHERFRTLTRNIRKRRGSKVEIKVPLFIDEKTAEEKNKVIEMDAMGFGMGCCCLQVTLQAQNMMLSRFLYDQLVVLSPFFLALTASTPFHRGHISDWDVRWNIISQSVDCRTPGESGKSPLEGTQKRISKSRFSPVSSYLSCNEKRSQFDTQNLTIDHDYYSQLINSGVDELMARHIAHLFIRDPLVIYHSLIHQDDNVSTNHFENIQSTNWQTCRLKPPSGKESGWRVEFRAMEIQMTDFENAAFSVFIALLSRAILHFEIEFYLPMNLVHDNMEESHRRNACIEGIFNFRSNFLSFDNDRFRRYSLTDIFNGNKEFGGLIKIVEDYLKIKTNDEKALSILKGYTELIRKRASGELMTTASWMRKFVKDHQDYEKDSMISPQICSDLIERVMEITNGKIKERGLLGDYRAPLIFDKKLFETNSAVQKENNFVELCSVDGCKITNSPI